MSSRCSRRELLELPNELIVLIVSTCEPRNILCFCSVNARVNQLGRDFDLQLWKPICLAQFPRLKIAVAAAAQLDDFSYRDLFFRETIAVMSPPPTMPALPPLQEVLQQFVVSMELHIGTETPPAYDPPLLPSTETPGLVACCSGRIDELDAGLRLWSPGTAPAWLLPEATCDTFTKQRLIVYLTWLYKAPRTLKIYDSEFCDVDGDGGDLCFCSQTLCCGPDECDGSFLNDNGLAPKPELKRQAEMSATISLDGRVGLTFGYECYPDPANPEYDDALTVRGQAQQQRFMAMHFPCLPWPSLPNRRAAIRA